MTSPTTLSDPAIVSRLREREAARRAALRPAPVPVEVPDPEYYRPKSERFQAMVRTIRAALGLR